MPSGFLNSFTPLLKRLKKYLIEIAILTVALVITVVALAVYAKNNQENTSQKIVINDQSEQTSTEKIFIDVSGAVKNPNLYQMSFGARLKDVVDKAGGLSDEVDSLFFSRNFNLAKILTDQEKIYIPSIAEINDGVFIQNQRTLDYTIPTNMGVESNAATDDSGEIININYATVEELDQLPGVGQITANKIITNRPYANIEELSTKKVVNKNVFEKIKTLISI